MSGPVVLLKAIQYSGSGAWFDQTTFATKHNATVSAGTIAKNALGNGIVLNGSTYWSMNDAAVGNAWTANVWYKENGTGGSYILVQQFSNSPMNISIGDNFVGNGSYQGGFFSGGFRNGTSFTLTQGQWTNIQVTWNGTNITTYINGTSIGTTTPGVSTGTNIGLGYNIGGHFQATSKVTGEIGEVRIYNYPLNQTQVTADYNSSVSTFIPPTSLNSLTFSSVTQTSFNVSWSGGTGATGYTYTLTDSSGNITTSNYSGYTSSASLSGLLSGTTYSLVISATNFAGSSLSSPRTVITAPGIPVSLSESAASQSGFTINWSGAQGATSFTFSLTDQSGNIVSTTPTSSTSTSATFTNLANKAYLFIVTANLVDDGINRSSSSATFTAYTLPSIPIPSGVSSISSSSFRIDWTAGEGASSYTFRLNGSLVTPSTNEGLSQKYAIFTGLIPGTSYTVIILANNQYSSSESDSINTVTIPVAVTSLSETSPTQSGFTINWVTTNGDGTSYIYTLNTYSAIPSSYTSRSATFTGLQPGPYLVNITPLSTTGTADSLEFQAQTLPSTPVLLSSSVTITSFEIVWTGGDAATSYTYILNDSPRVASLDQGVENKYASFTGLIAGQLYTIVIIANNASGFSSSSSTNIVTVPDVPAPLSQSLSSPSGFRISWQGALGATSYTYVIRDANGNILTPTTNDQGLASKYIEFSGLAVGSYTILVTANNSAGSTSSSIFYAATLPTVPYSIVTSNITTSGFQVAWSGGETATSYTYILNGSLVIPSSDQGVSQKYAIFTELLPGAIYNVLIIATNSSGSSSASTSLSTAPVKPESLSQTSLTSSSFTVNWISANGNGTTYTYTLNGNTTLAASSTRASASFTGLTSETSYNIIVTANSTGGFISSDSFTSFTLPTPALSLVFSNVTTTSFRVSWSGANDATLYRYYLNNQYVIPSNDQGITSKYADFTNLTPGKAYYLVIINSYQNISSASSTNSIILPPTQPYNLTYYITSSDTIRVSWLGGLGAKQYIYTMNNVDVTPVIDKGVQSNYVILNTQNIGYKIVVTAVSGSNEIQSADLNASLLIRPLTTSKKTLVCIYTEKYPFSFGEFIRGFLYLINYAITNRMGVRLNIENTTLFEYLIVDNYVIPPGNQIRIYYDEKDNKLLADDLETFRHSPDSIMVLTTNRTINKNDIDTLSMIEFNKLIRFNSNVYEMVNTRLQRELINSIAPPLITDDYNVLNMYLADLSLDRAQIQHLATQVRATIDIRKTYIVVSNSTYLRSTLTGFLGGYHVLGNQTIDTLDALESSIVDFVIVSRSKKIYTFSEYNTKLKKAICHVGESTSLSSVVISKPGYVTTKFAGIYQGGPFTDGTRETATFAYPCGITEDSSGNFYVADTMNNNIRLIQPNGAVTTLAGSQIQVTGSADGPNAEALFLGPTGVTVHENNHVYVVDAINGLIREITPEGYVKTIAGSTAGFQDGTGSGAQFKFVYATNP